jgi:elongation factor Ts
VSTQVSAGLVKELREATGAGMMDCKRALEETGGDLEAAQRLLREKGIAAAGKRGTHGTTEGKIVYRLGETVAALVAVGCETEPVSNNEEFLTFAQRVADAVEDGGPDAAASLDGERIQLIAKLGENVVVRDAVRFEADEGEILSAYVHPPAHKLGALVHARGNGDLAYQLAMHITASRPAYVSRDDVPQEAVTAEREILEKQPDVESKPEHIRGKIVEGRLDKWLAEQVLLEQPWIHDTDKTVGQALAESGLEVVEFSRLSVAE